jgi:hypothetical protein
LRSKAGEHHDRQCDSDCRDTPGLSSSLIANQRCDKKEKDAVEEARRLTTREHCSTVPRDFDL